MLRTNSDGYSLLSTRPGSRDQRHALVVQAVPVIYVAIEDVQPAQSWTQCGRSVLSMAAGCVHALADYVDDMRCAIERSTDSRG